MAVYCGMVGLCVSFPIKTENAVPESVDSSESTPNANTLNDSTKDPSDNC